MKLLRSTFVFSGLLAAVFAMEPATEHRPHPIKWDAMEKTIEAKPKDSAAEFVFKATNTSDQPVTMFTSLPGTTMTRRIVLPAM